MLNAKPTTAPSSGALLRIFAWRRVKVVLITCFIFNLLLGINWEAPMWMLTTRLLMIGMTQLIVFGVLETWPQQPPRWISRWAMQVLGVALVTPFIAFAAYTITLTGTFPRWWTDSDRLTGWFTMTLMGLLVAPWISVSALFKKITNAAEKQALAFALEKSELERRASEARLGLVQAQMEPHFLFNTLANIRELVLAGSPQAPAVLDSLIAYLRAAVPRLRDHHATLSQELELVRAYLDIMRMRMPDRLTYSIDADTDTLALPCPPMSLLTLVENAVRHGIDPQEDGGSIHIRAQRIEGSLRIAVSDDGRGISDSAQTVSGSSASGLGTGLPQLRERLRLSHGAAAQLTVSPRSPRGTLAVMQWPATSEHSATEQSINAL